MSGPIDHPYWDFFQKVITIRDQPHSDAQAELTELAHEANFSVTELATARMLLSVSMKLKGLGGKSLEEKFFIRLREIYAYSVFPPSVLEIVADLSPIVELGAGNGYGAYLLQQLGADVVALEAFPVEEGQNWFFSTSRIGLPTKRGKSFTKVDKGDAASLKDYPDRTLLMCWPPRNMMAVDALTNFQGSKLALIAEKNCCGNAAFYKKLTSDWQLLLCLNTESWNCSHQEVLEIYERKKATT
jgi:hypothetical protein